MEDGIPVTDRTVCSGCFACMEMCPGDARIGYGMIWEPEALADKLAEAKPFFDNSSGGVTLSGGECLAQPVFAEALAEALQRRNIAVNIDTCGFTTRQVLDRILPFADTFLYDLKAIDPEVHRKCTGQDNRCILENLRYLTENGAKIEIRYPLVPDWNDGECEKIGAFLAGLPRKHKIKVLGYHSLADGKYHALGIRSLLPVKQADADMVEKAAETLRRFGLQAVNGMKDD